MAKINRWGNWLARGGLRAHRQLRNECWTSDDFRSASEDEDPIAAKTQEGSASETLEKFRLLGKEDLGTAVLRRGNAPNVDFPSRKDSEERLFEAKQTWLNQVDRMVAHKDSSKDSQNTEIRLAQGAQKTLSASPPKVLYKRELSMTRH